MRLRQVRLEDKDFLIKANDVVNQASGITTPSKLGENFEKDFFGRNPKVYCVIAEEKGKQVGFMSYSYVYWTNRGRGLYISNIYIEPESRGNGIFGKFMNYIKKVKGINFYTLIVGNENQKMKDILSHYGAEDLDMKAYYMK